MKPIYYLCSFGNWARQFLFIWVLTVLCETSEKRNGVTNDSLYNYVLRNSGLNRVYMLNLRQNGEFRYSATYIHLTKFDII